MSIKPDDIVQLCPHGTENPMFAGCLMTVVGIKPWGVVGYVQALGENGEPGGQAYYRAKTGTFLPTGGKSPWINSMEAALRREDATRE